MSVPILPLEEMSVEEKLQTMEALWQSLSSDPAAVESPAWHQGGVSGTRTEDRIRRGKVRRVGKSES